MATYTPIFLNNYKAYLSNDLGNGTTTMLVDTPLPELPFGKCYYLTIFSKAGFQEYGWEVVRVIAVDASGKELTVERGMENMSQHSFVSGSYVEMRLTAGMMNELYCRTRKNKIARFLDL